MTATLIFETHATSLDNEAGVASGWYDVGLSECGLREAAELGRRHTANRPSVVFCSDLVRARRTAEIAFAGEDIPIVSDARLRECDYGAFTRRESALIDAVRLDAITQPFPGGESYEEAVRRVARWLDDLRTTSIASPIVVIGHRATFYAFEHLLRAIPLRDVIAAEWKWQAGWHYCV